jgi:two-component system chemotaxis response regulator CheY
VAGSWLLIATSHLATGHELFASLSVSTYHTYMSKKTVLLVEDDKLIRESLAQVLEEKGLHVIQASNGEEGLEKALAGGVDLVATDVIMPKKDGLTMLSELRKGPSGKDIPAIVLSNDDHTESLNKALEAGVTIYLSKASLDAEGMAAQVMIALGS